MTPQEKAQFHLTDPTGAYERLQSMFKTGDQYVKSGVLSPAWVTTSRDLTHWYRRALERLARTGYVASLDAVEAVVQSIELRVDQGYTRLGELHYQTGAPHAKV